MTSERKRKSRATGVKTSRSDQLQKNKLYMRKYREENAADKNEPEAGKSSDDMEIKEEDGKKKKTGGEKEKALSRKENLAAVLKKQMKK